ncbi:MAG: hypothetical protein WCG91_04190 [Candidatus Shapirobacteria bacterium]
MTEVVSGYDHGEKMIHIEPKLVIDRAIKPTVLKSKDGQPVIEGFSLPEGNVFLVRDFIKNNTDPDVSELIEKLTGFSRGVIYEKVRADLSGSEDLLATRDVREIKENVTALYHEGDSLILDPILQKERDGKVEFVMVKGCKLGKQKGESVLVRMWRYGALKQLVLPEGNPGNQIGFELFLCLKNRLTIVVPGEVEDQNGLLVAKDEGVKLELKMGDFALLPLVPRQIISNGGNFTDRGAKYFTLGPAWGGKGGVDQKPVYWPSQIQSK